MKLSSVKLARTVFLFPAGDVNPAGKYLLPILSALIKRYRFATFPSFAEAVQTDQGIKLAQGVFSHREWKEIAVDLAIYNDGLVADTRAGTDVSEAFIEDLFSWIRDEHGLERPRSITKQYISEIIVETNASLISLNVKLERFARNLTAKVKGFGKVSYQLTGLSLWTEQFGPVAAPGFRFERAVGVPRQQDRYYSVAPLRTADHVLLLEQLEEILRG